MPQLVKDVMQRDVVTVTPDTPVLELLRMLVANQISGLPVVSREGEIMGVVSTTDVIRLGSREVEIGNGTMTWEPLALPAEEVDEENAADFFMISMDWAFPTEDQTRSISLGVFDGFTVGDIMTSAVFTVEPDQRVSEVAKFLLKGRIHRALVVEDGHLQGIVTAFDLLKAFLED